MYADFFWFAVPIRLVWENWHKFNGAQDNPGDSTTFLIPQMTTEAAGIGVGTLGDYLGIPTEVKDLTHSTLWHRAYSLIFNEWFRDEDLQASVTVDTDNGPDTMSDYVLRTRGKRHDYFTSCKPWPQKGTAVPLPLGVEAKIATAAVFGGDTVVNVLGTGGTVAVDLDGADPLAVKSTLTTAANYLYADLSTATAATINELREAFAIQKVYERDARGGTRLTEVIRSHFGVVSPDARLQRPEYLGGGHQNINVTPVPQTSTTSGVDSEDQLGNLGAYATSTGQNGFVKSFTEHCVLLGLVSVRADQTYQHGLSRMMSRRTRWDFYWPAFQALGEQAVLSKELFARGSDGDGYVDITTQGEDTTVFGYQERWAEYRYAPSRLCGLFRSSGTHATLDPWHLAIDMGDPVTDNAPTLGANFIKEQVPMVRVNAVPAEPDFLGDFFFNLKCARPMPTYSVPGMIDHF